MRRKVKGVLVVLGLCAVSLIANFEVASGVDAAIALAEAYRPQARTHDLHFAR